MAGRTKITAAMAKSLSRWFVGALFLVGSTVTSWAQFDSDVEFPKYDPPVPIQKPNYDSGYDKPKPGKARVVVVDRDGKKGTFKTIQAGIKAAGRGGIVRVNPTPLPYKETLYIGFPVTVESLYAGQPVYLQSDYIDPCLYVSLYRNGVVKMSDMHWLKPSSELDYRAQPCIIVESGYFILKDSLVEGTIHNPAVVLSGGSSRIENSVIVNGQVGVRIDAAPDGEYFLFGNEITGNVDGVRINGRAVVQVHDNKIHGNIQNGIVNVDGGGSYIFNKIYENGDAGILLQRSTLAPLFASNYIFGNQKAGFRVWPDANGLIDRNQICKNVGPAIDGGYQNPLVVVGPGNEIFENIGDPGKKKKRRWGSRRDDDYEKVCGPTF